MKKSNCRKVPRKMPARKLFDVVVRELMVNLQFSCTDLLDKTSTRKLGHVDVKIRPSLL